MKKNISIVFILMLINFSVAQVGISTTNPHVSAELDVTSTTRGLLLPRLTTTAINTLTATASEGLVVFNTTTKQYWGFNGTSWQIFTTTIVGGSPQVATFASWEVGGLSAFGVSPFAGTVSQVTSASLTRGSGLTTVPTAPPDVWGASGFNAAADVATAVLNNDFVGVSIVLPSSSTFSFTKIAAHNIRRSTAGPQSAQWQYSINGGTTYINVGSVGSVSSTANTGNVISEITLSSVPALQGLSNTTVLFRLVLYGGTGGGNAYINNNSILTDLEFIGTYQ